ncbi:MAG: LysR family transcriptional regulator [Pseudomonadota bacterium]
MNIQQISTFVWVIKLGGFRRAADKLNASQGAISARIAALEEQLGHVLLERGSGGIRPTPKGCEFLAYAEQVLRLTDDVQTRLARPDHMRGTLRLGVSETIVHSWLPIFLSEFATSYPRIELDLSVDVTVNLRDALLGRSIDLAFLLGPVSEFSVTNVKLASFEMGWLAGPKTASGFERRKRDELLSETPIVTFARNTRPFNDVRVSVCKLGFPTVRIFPTTSLAAGYQMVRHDVAIGALPIELIAEPVGSLSITPIDIGLKLKPLSFTASYVGDPPNGLAAEAAAMAEKIAARPRS